MGQQQLILLVLATIIVGLAIVVGIRAFTENSIKSNSDAMMQDAVRMANDAQAWKQKPGPFGGQAQYATAAQVANPAAFNESQFDRLGYAVDRGTGIGQVYVNLNGEFQLSLINDSLRITGRSPKFENEIQVTVGGLRDTDISGQVTCLGGQSGTGAACAPAAF